MSTSTPAPTRPKDEDRVLVRPWPKVIFLYPTLIVSLIGWAVSLFTTENGQVGDGTLGMVWVLVFCFNLLVFAFDFSRIKSITLLVAILGLVFVGLWANTNWSVFEPLKNMLSHLDIRMNTQFYGFFSVFFCFMFLLVFINTRFNYYEINRNEILHHHGYLGDIRRTPTTAMRMNKEIYDLMEHLLLRSGRLVIFSSTQREAIVIDNIININLVEERIKNLLSKVAVSIDIEDDQATNLPM